MGVVERLGPDRGQVHVVVGPVVVEEVDPLEGRDLDLICRHSDGGLPECCLGQRLSRPPGMIIIMAR